MKPVSLAPPVVLVLALAASACASARTGTAAAPASPGAAAEFEAIYRARTDSARMRFTEADVHFMTGMIAHHAQALVMTALVPKQGASASVRTLGARITNSQLDEIATMQKWLHDRGQPVPAVNRDGTMPMAAHAEHGMHMPGMLSAAQLQELAAARDTAFDRLFLGYMIQHHRGAVAMVEELFATDGAGQDEAVFKFASDVQVDQRTEIARMESLLAALPRDGSARLQ
jgi:uncharacterized protein (DUF305 family)